MGNSFVFDDKPFFDYNPNNNNNTPASSEIINSRFEIAVDPYSSLSIPYYKSIGSTLGV